MSQHSPQDLSHSSAEPDADLGGRSMTRRLFAAFLGGGIGSAAMSGCMTPEELEQLEGESGKASGALTGSAAALWCDTYAELQSFAGGDTPGAANVAVVRGNSAAAVPGPPPGGGGLFV